MSPMISWFACFIALPAVGFVIIEFAIRSYFRPTSKEEKKKIVAILVLMGLLTYYLFFTDKAPTTPPARYAEHNTAVLAKVKEGDLLLCFQPGGSPFDQHVMYAFLVESIQRTETYSWLRGHLLDKNSFVQLEGFSTASFFDNKCQLHINREDGLGFTDKKIGRILRLGLNAPTPN